MIISPLLKVALIETTQAFGKIFVARTAPAPCAFRVRIVKVSLGSKEIHFQEGLEDRCAPRINGYGQGLITRIALFEAFKLALVEYVVPQLVFVGKLICEVFRERLGPGLLVGTSDV